jgi:hypothetical protein
MFIGAEQAFIAADFNAVSCLFGPFLNCVCKCEQGESFFGLVENLIPELL